MNARYLFQKNAFLRNFNNYRKVLLFFSIFCFTLFLITPISLPEFDASQRGKVGVEKSNSFDCEILLQGSGLVSSPVLNGWKTNLKLPAGFSQVRDNVWRTNNTKQLSLKSNSFVKQSMVFENFSSVNFSCVSGSISKAEYPNKVVLLDLNPEVVSGGSARGYLLLAQGKFTFAANQILESLYSTTIAWFTTLFFVLAFTLFGHTKRSIDGRLSFVLGMLLSAILMGSLNYFVSGFTSSVLVFSILIIKLIINIKSKLDFTSIADVLKVPILGSIFTLLFGSSLLSFTNIGLAQTDSELYRAALPRMLETKLLNEPGLFIGNGMRSLDWSSRSLIYFFPSTTPGSTLVIWAILLFLAAVFTIASLSRHSKPLLKSNLVAISIIIVSTSAIGLWMEAYLTKLNFLLISVIVLVTGFTYSKAKQEGKDSQILLLIYALASAWCFSIQPFSALLVFSLPFYLLTKQKWRQFTFISLVFFIALVPTSLWMRKIWVAVGFTEGSQGLNGIGRNIIWPNYSDPTIFAQLLGFQSWHASGTTRPITHNVMVQLTTFESVLIDFLKTSSVFFSVFLVLYFAKLIIQGKAKFNSFSLHFFIFLSLNVLIINFVIQDNFYLLFSTLVCLVPLFLLIFFMNFDLDRAPTSTFRVVLILVAIFSITASLREVSLYLRNPQGIVSKSSYVNYAFEAARVNAFLGESNFEISNGSNASNYEALVLGSELITQRMDTACRNCSFTSDSILVVTKPRQEARIHVVIIGNCLESYRHEGNFGPYSICKK
jgi:hypothetical protein